MPRPRAKKPRAVRPTRGSVAYADLVARSTHAAIARRLGVSEALSRALAAGQRKPGDAVRVKLEPLGIPSEQWDAPAPRSRRPRTTAPLSPPPAPSTPAVPLGSAHDVTRNTCERLQRELDRLDQDPLATAQQRASVASALTTSTRLFARLSGALDVTREQLLRSPHWRPLVAVLVAALAPFEGAAEAVAKALRDFEGSGET
jgi:hypothetical protein